VVIHSVISSLILEFQLSTRVTRQTAENHIIWFSHSFALLFLRLVNLTHRSVQYSTCLSYSGSFKIVFLSYYYTITLLHYLISTEKQLSKLTDLVVFHPSSAWATQLRYVTGWVSSGIFLIFKHTHRLKRTKANLLLY